MTPQRGRLPADAVPLPPAHRPRAGGCAECSHRPLRRATPAGWYIITYGLGIYALNLLIGFLSPATDPETEGPTLPTSKDDEFRPFVRRLPEFKFWRGLAAALAARRLVSEGARWTGRYGLTKAFCVAFCMTFFSIFNIPVFWPILLMCALPCPGVRSSGGPTQTQSSATRATVRLGCVAPLRRAGPRPADARRSLASGRYFFALFFLTMKRQIKHMIKYKCEPPLLPRPPPRRPPSPRPALPRLRARALAARSSRRATPRRYVPFSFGKAKYKGKEGEGGSRSAE